MFGKEIIGARLILRGYKESDIQAWHIWDTDQDVQEFLPEPKNKLATKAEQVAYLKQCQNEDDAYYWTIVLKETNESIGTVALTDINIHHGVCELSVIIGDKTVWGKGLATEAMTLALGFAKEIKLRRVTAEFEEQNIGIAKALQTVGFSEECVKQESRIKNGSPINTISYYKLL